MDVNLLKPREVDLLLRYPAGRSLRLAKAGLMTCIHLPDGEVRFDEADIERLLKKSEHGKAKEIQPCSA